jgi:hypothetical protein
MDKKTPEEIKDLDNYIKCTCVDCLIHGAGTGKMPVFSEVTPINFKSTIKGDHSKNMIFDIDGLISDTDKESSNEN